MTTLESPVVRATPRYPQISAQIESDLLALQFIREKHWTSSCPAPTNEMLRGFFAGLDLDMFKLAVVRGRIVALCGAGGQ